MTPKLSYIAPLFSVESVWADSVICESPLAFTETFDPLTPFTW